jgi:putative peptidoglycan lipid II flippase
VLAPLLSSFTMMATYVTFAAVAGRGADLAQARGGALTLLGWGTTAAIAVLALCLLIPVRRLRLTLRPRLRLDADVRRRLVRLVGASVVLVTAEQLATAWLIRLANDGPDGSVVLLTIVQKIAFLPVAVLALPLIIATYPQLARAVAGDDHPGFDALLARTLRWVLLAAGLGVASLASGATFIARTLSAVTASHPDPAMLAHVVTAFAPSVFGLALAPLLTRALTADGVAGRAAIQSVLGWSVAAAVAGLAVELAPLPDRVVALGVAWSVGLSVLGVGLLVSVARRRGRGALTGGGRAGLVSLVGAALGGSVGSLVGGPLPLLGPLVGAAVFAAVAATTLRREAAAG